MPQRAIEQLMPNWLRRNAAAVGPGRDRTATKLARAMRKIADRLNKVGSC